MHAMHDDAYTLHNGIHRVALHLYTWMCFKVHKHTLKESAGDGPGDRGPCLIDCAPLIGLGEEERCAEKKA